VFKEEDDFGNYPLPNLDFKKQNSMDGMIPCEKCNKPVKFRDY